MTDERQAELRSALLEILRDERNAGGRAPKEYWSGYRDGLETAMRRVETYPFLAVAQVPAEERLDRRILEWAAAQPVGFGDWACVDCRPESDMLVAGFRCVVHEARRALGVESKETP